MYEQLKKLIVEANEDKSKFIKPTHGTCCTCQRCGQGYDDCVCLDEDDLNLEHVLVAIQKTGKDCGFIGVDRNGQFMDCDKDMNNVKILGITWQLTKPLSDQKPETLEFLYSILK